MTPAGRVRGRLRVGISGFLVSAMAMWFLCDPSTAALRPALDPIGAGSGLLGASPAGPVGSLGQGVTSIASTATTDLALAEVEAWVSGGATFVMHETASVLTKTTTPRLDSTWFSAVYWKVAGLAAMLTLPFLFAASVQALIRSDLTLLVRAALGYLPLSMLAVAVAAPLTMLLLSASDQLAAAVSSAAGHESVNFLTRAIDPLGITAGFSGSPFLIFLLGLFTVAGALMLWIELLMREAAVYVIVLMLPLAFAAFVWPARRIWAIRSLEVLAALILSKFAIVAVLSLGGVALGHSPHTSVAAMLSGLVLLILGSFTPWALLRLLPLAELASGAVGALSGQAGVALRASQPLDGLATVAHGWVTKTAHMRRSAGEIRAARLPSPPARPGATKGANRLAPAEDTAAAAPEPTAPVPVPEPTTAAPAPEPTAPVPVPEPAGPATAPATSAEPAPPSQWILAGRVGLEPGEPSGRGGA